MSFSRRHGVKAWAQTSWIAELQQLNIRRTNDPLTPSTSAIYVPGCYEFDFGRVQLCVHARHGSPKQNRGPCGENN